MENYNKLQELATSTDYYRDNITMEICDSGLIFKLNKCVIVSFYHDWNDLFTHVYMSKAVFESMLNDRRRINSNLPIPVFAMAYGYGKIKGYNKFIDDVNNNPFVDLCVQLVNSDISRMVANDFALLKQCNTCGDPEKQIIYRLTNHDSDPIGFFDDFNRAREAVLRMGSWFKADAYIVPVTLNFVNEFYFE